LPYLLWRETREGRGVGQRIISGRHEVQIRGRSERQIQTPMCALTSWCNCAHLHPTRRSKISPGDTSCSCTAPRYASKHPSSIRWGNTLGWAPAWGTAMEPAMAELSASQLEATLGEASGRRTAVASAHSWAVASAHPSAAMSEKMTGSMSVGATAAMWAAMSEEMTGSMSVGATAAMWAAGWAYVRAAR
jgi:hypothetical protein